MPGNAAPSGAPTTPLYVDLDGSLIATDLLHESVLRLMRAAPAALLQVPAWLLQGKAVLKHEIADRVEIDVATLPYRPEVLALVREARANGRRVVLATASDARYARAVANHLQLFDAVIASDGRRNLGGAAKLEAIRADAGGRPFTYVGDRALDMPIWREAQGAVVVGRSAALARRAAELTTVEARVEPPPVALKRYLYGMRVHQWLKNVLIFLPFMPVLHELHAGLVIKAAIAFLAFGLMASSIYVLNDLLDLESDRRHKRKRTRPFASGEIPAMHGALLALGLCASSLLLSFAWLPRLFVDVLLFYMLLTTAYSFWFKRRGLVDVFALAGLYTVRVGAGAAATGLPLSFWILSFSLFVFLSLALAKRFVELSGTPAEQAQMSRDRGYHPVDVTFVLCTGVAAGQMSALLLSLYFQDQQMASRYSHPFFLWALIPVYLFWIMRIWLKAIRGVLHDDPVIFAARDWVSRLAVGIAACVLWIAG